MRFLFFTLIIMGTSIVTMPTPSYGACAAGVPCLKYNPRRSNPIANEAKDGNSQKFTYRGRRVTSCDGNFMNQIVTKAFLEARKETVYNQIYVRKPDSVMAYSCFEQDVDQAADQAPPLFSESEKWKNIKVTLNIADVKGGQKLEVPVNVSLGKGHIKGAMDASAKTPATTFMGSNFGHSAGGGSLSQSGTCMTMATIWQLAKCQSLEAPDDLFLSFEDLVSNDPRTLPAACPGTGITEDHISIAKNAVPAMKAFDWDIMMSNVSLIAGVTHPVASGPCGSAIPTGLQVQQYDITIESPSGTNFSGVTKTENFYEEQVCIQPGCYFDGTVCKRVP